MEHATAIMDSSATETKCLVKEEALESPFKSEAFDGIILLISRDVFEFFQRESGNSDDRYHDIYVAPTCAELQESKNANGKNTNDEKDVLNNNSKKMKREIKEEYSFTEAAQIELNESNGVPEETQSVNAPTEDATSGSESSEDSSDNSDNDKAMEDGDSGEESEDTLRSKLLNEFLADKKNRKLLKSLRKIKRDKKESKFEKDFTESENKSEEKLSTFRSKDRDESSRNQEKNVSIQREERKRNSTSLEVERKRSNASIETERKRNYMSTETSPRRHVNQNNGQPPIKREKRSTDMSPRREDLKHSSNNYSSSPRNGTSSNYGERFGAKSTKYEESTQYSWKRKSDSWDNTYLNEKNKFISPERRPWNSNFRSDNYEENKYQKVNSYQRSYPKYRNYTHW